MPAYFPENNTTQWGDTAERSLQKISDLLKNGDVPIKINSVAVTGPFTVNNEVEITNDVGNPLPLGGRDANGDIVPLTLTAEDRLKVDSQPFELFAEFNLAPGAHSPAIHLDQLPNGSVLLFDSPNWNSGSWQIQVGNPVGAGYSWGFPVSVYGAYTQAVAAGFGVAEGPALFRKFSFPSVVRIQSVSNSTLNTTIRVYLYKELDFGTGFPHVNSLSSLVYSLDNNLKVSDLQTQTRIGDLPDQAATSDTGSFSLISLFKRLLDRLTTGVINKLPALGQTNMAGSIPVTVANNQSEVPVSGTVAVSNGFATQETLSTLSNKIPSDLTVTDSKLNVNTGLVLPSALGQTIMTGSLPVVLASDQSAVTVRALSGSLQTTEGELTDANSTQVLPAALGSRRYLFIQNLSSAPIYLNFTPAIGSAPATPNSMRLDAGASLSFEGNFVPNNAVNLLRSATTNQRYFIMTGN